MDGRRYIACCSIGITLGADEERGAPRELRLRGEKGRFWRGVELVESHVGDDADDLPRLIADVEVAAEGIFVAEQTIDERLVDDENAGSVHMIILRGHRAAA